LDIVRKEGVDRLTLGHVAVCAGVSKPIAYEHFGTRSGLLIALYKAVDGQQVEALRAALAAAPHGLDEAAKLVAEAYMHCYADSTGEWHAVAAALSGDEAMHAVHQELLGSYAALFAAALAPHTRLSEGALLLRCVGLVGAAEAISEAMARGEVREAEAAGSLAALMKGSIASD
jgi:AcrR family transcriptional regulator